MGEEEERKQERGVRGWVSWPCVLLCSLSPETRALDGLLVGGGWDKGGWGRVMVGGGKLILRLLVPNVPCVLRSKAGWAGDQRETSCVLCSHCALWWFTPLSSRTPLVPSLFFLSHGVFCSIARTNQSAVTG